MQDFCPCDLCSDPADDGPEIRIIRNEQINDFLDWYAGLPAAYERSWKLASEFVQRWSENG